MPERGKRIFISESMFGAMLNGYGALFFAPTPLSGALLLLATFALNPSAGTLALLALLAATVTARWLRRPEEHVAAGLYGYSGALAAFGIASLTGLGDWLQPVCVLASAATVPLVSLLLEGRWCRRLGLPMLSLPGLMVAYSVIGLACWLGASVAPAAFLPAHLFEDMAFRGDNWDAAFDWGGGMLLRDWAVKALIASAYVIYSPRLAVLAAAGGLLALGVGHAALGWTEGLMPSWSFSWVVACGMQVFIALAGYFTGHGWRAWVFAGCATAAAFPLWWYGSHRLAEFGIPALTMPFFVTTLGCIMLLRLLARWQGGLLPVLIPLHRVGTPQENTRFSSERSAGLRYWEALARVRPATKPNSAGGDMARARELLQAARSIVVISGAGVSTESGIPDYRTGAVAWKKYDTSHFRFENFLASEESRRLYWEMSQDFFLLLRTARPNATHRAITQLQEQGRLAAVITQNVDRLHQAAGTDDKRVIEIHGNEHSVSCLRCHRRRSRDEIYRWIVGGITVPYCPSCQGILKPDSVAFGQPMDDAVSRRALEAVQHSDLLLILGTSLQVQPVASLPLVALRAGIPVVVLNLEPTDFDPFAQVVLHGPCGALLSALVPAN